MGGDILLGPTPGFSDVLKHQTSAERLTLKEGQFLARELTL